MAPVMATVMIAGCGISTHLGALHEVERANIAALGNFFDQGDQRGGTERVGRPDRTGGFERIELGTGIERGEQQVVVRSKWTALAPQFRNAGFEQVTGPDLYGFRAVR